MGELCLTFLGFARRRQESVAVAGFCVVAKVHVKLNVRLVGVWWFFSLDRVVIKYLQGKRRVHSNLWADMHLLSKTSGVLAQSLFGLDKTPCRSPSRRGKREKSSPTASAMRACMPRNNHPKPSSRKLHSSRVLKLIKCKMMDQLMIWTNGFFIPRYTPEPTYES
jgi:hypothetical protein